MSSQQMDAQWLPQEGETLVFDTNPVLNERQTHYCPGCHHGTAHRLVADVLDNPRDEANIAAVRAKVNALTSRFPVYR